MNKTYFSPSGIPQQYSNYLTFIVEISIYGFSLALIVLKMIELLKLEDSNFYYGLAILFLLMIQGFYGSLNKDLTQLMPPRLCIFVKLTLLEHFFVLFFRSKQATEKAATQIYASSLSTSFFQARILSVASAYLITFYSLQNSTLTFWSLLTIASTSLNVGMYNPKYYISEGTCSEDMIHYTVEIYARSSFYSIIMLIDLNENYSIISYSTLTTFFCIYLIATGSICVLQIIFNLCSKNISFQDTIVGSLHLLGNAIFLRLPSNIAVYKCRLLFMKGSAYVINFQVVLFSALLRLSECICFFYLYFRYLNQNIVEKSNEITQIRIALISTAIYLYILVFQILYIAIAHQSNMRDSIDQTATPSKEENTVLQSSNQILKNYDQSADSQRQLKGNIIQLKNHKGIGVITQLNTEKLPMVLSQDPQNYQQNASSSHSPLGQILGHHSDNQSPSSTDNGSAIFQIGLSDSHGIQALKIFNPVINPKFPFPATKKP